MNDISDETLAILKDAIRDVPDFPKPGILFKDITPLLSDRRAFGTAINLLTRAFAHRPIDAVVAIDSRGFIFGSPLAMRLGAKLVPARKPGKLPAATHRVTYALEYGEGELEMHKDALGAGDRVVVVDDLLATGGTAQAAAELAARCGATVVGFAFVVELSFLEGRPRLSKHFPEATCDSLVRYA